ncbi:MAG: translation initiation factor IF-2 [Lachnospiraceae bacterium]|jgi:translation initiation factor IF-2
MSKLRVHELAKELDKTNKEVLDFLKSKGVELKSHMSSLEDDHEKMVRNHFGLAKEDHKVQENAENKPKKKNIIQVFRPQNASSQPRGGQNRPNQNRQGGHRPNGQNVTAQSQERPQRGERPAGSRPQNTQGGQRPYNSNGPRNNGPREGVVRDNASKESQGGQRPFHHNGPRTEGSRPYNNNSKPGEGRGPRPDGQRPFHNNGPRNFNGQRDGVRTEGQKPYHNNSKPGEGRGRDNERSFSKDGSRREFSSRDNQGGQRSFGGRSQDRREKAVPDLKMEMADKDSRKNNRENKKKDNRRDEYQNQNGGGKRPNQGGRRPNQRLPKALQKPAPQPKVPEKKEEVKEITLPEKMTIRELADKMKMQPSVLVKNLFLKGILVTVNHEIEFERAQELALEYDILAEPEEKVDVIEELLREEEEDESLLVSRPPVVCVMGHVDHGKTSLLDCIRNTHVTDREAGGITQHIGAYMVTINGQKITFLDTPGHEAFTAMRMRGANATDIAILVVAADDGVMPQTVEAINHAKAAGVEIIVAINKIDKPSANVDRVKQELSEYELLPEDWGGSTIFVPVSARTGEGIDDLLEMILLTAEVCELKANPKRRARGLVIEAELDKGKGPVATILVQKGTLHVGDFIAAGASSGKVRAMMDDKGRRVKEATPSTPVEILGLNDVPNAGEVLVATENDKEAKNFAATFISENKNKLLDETKAKMSLDDLFNQIQAGNLKELPLIVKADVQGSVEAVKQSLIKLSNEEVVVKVIHGGVGAINESDVSLASASNAIIIGFNVRPDATAKTIAEQEGVDLRLYRVIYQAIEDVEAAMKGMLEPIYEEKVIGHAEVRQIFKASGVGNIAGSYVTDGVFQRNCSVRISREGDQIFEGHLASLKRFKDDVKEVKAGYECGLVFEGFNDIREEDQVEAYIMVEVPR